MSQCISTAVQAIVGIGMLLSVFSGDGEVPKADGDWYLDGYRGASAAVRPPKGFAEKSTTN